jgi:hypothetical protein
MIFKLIIAGLAVFGMLCLASVKWPALFNEAVNLGGYSISGVMIVGFVIFAGICSKGGKR